MKQVFGSSVAIKLLLIGVLYPGWSILLELALPGEFNAISERFLIGAFALLCLLFLRPGSKFRTYSTHILGFVILVMTLHFVILLFRSGISNVYVIGMLVYATAVGALVDSSRFYIAYALTYLVGTGLVCFLVAPPKETTVMLLAGLLTLAGIFLIILYTKEKLERELKASRVTSEASRHFAALGRFAAGVAHEVNNPLTVVIGNAEILKIKLTEDVPFDRVRALDKIDRIITMSFRAAKIISSLLVLTRPLVEKDVSVVKVDELVDLIKKSVKSDLTSFPAVSFSVKIGEGLSSVRCCVPDIVTALANLVKNAIGQFPDETTGSVTLDVSESKSNVFFRVIDSGAGVLPEYRDKIFQPFFTTKAVGEGEGLGLPIALGITLKHGGTLVLDESCKETTFELSIPKK